MNATRLAKNPPVGILWAAVILALFTALGYELIAFHILGVGDLSMDERPAGIIFVAAACYLLGGLLILLRNRWLLLFGAFVNAMVLLFFFNLYQDRPAVMFSPGGIVTKALQLALEAMLIYLVLRNWPRPRRQFA